MPKRSTNYGVVTPKELKSYDGLSFVRAIIDGTLPQPEIQQVARLPFDRGRERLR